MNSKVEKVSLLGVCLENPTNLFGKKLHEQVEDRLKFYETGEAPIKNADAMQDVLNEIKELEEATASEKKKKKKKKKKKHQENGEVENKQMKNGHAEEVNVKILTSLLEVILKFS